MKLLPSLDMLCLCISLLVFLDASVSAVGSKPSDHQYTARFRSEKLASGDEIFAAPYQSV